MHQNHAQYFLCLLENAGMSHVPVISISAGGLEKNPGFQLSPKLIHKMLKGFVYGDLLMRVLYRVPVSMAFLSIAGITSK